jgi:hypothetical protein
MRVLDLQPMLRYFREKFSDSIAFANSTGSGISIRYGPSIECEIAIFQYVPQQDHFTLTPTHRLVKNPSTNTPENFDILEKTGQRIEETCSVRVVFVRAYNKPPVC